MLTLWDILPAALKPRRRPRPAPGRRPEAAPPARPAKGRAQGRGTSPPPHAGGAPRPTKQDQYDLMAREMLDRYGVRVRRWRSSTTGLAWELRYRDGSVRRLIEAPRPRGPVSVAVFLHEIGHHAIGLGAVRPRCLEEFHAWEFALHEMRARGLTVTDAVERRRRSALRYAVAKARRRGLRDLPLELHDFAGDADRPAAR